jgi:hypothetical protein
VKQVDELFVGVPQRAAIGVKRHFQHASFRTSQAGIGESWARWITVASLI